ncbi:MAG: hypothetical protein ACYCQJ_01155 [Nitrososphaerales archaeon]
MSVSLDNEAYRNEIQILLEAIDLKIHRAIELDQLVLLDSELVSAKLKEKLDSESAERLESIVSRSQENAQILRELRKKLEEELLGARE